MNQLYLSEILSACLSLSLLFSQIEKKKSLSHKFLLF